MEETTRLIRENHQKGFFVMSAILNDAFPTLIVPGRNFNNIEQLIIDVTAKTSYDRPLFEKIIKNTENNKDV